LTPEPHSGDFCLILIIFAGRKHYSPKQGFAAY
jgi:hypothetical protein